MSFIGALLGTDASKAANAAAADTFAKQNAAIAGLNQAGDQFNTGMDTLSQAYSPYAATGTTANNMYQRLLADPTSVASLPQYQFGFDQGTRAIDNSAAARGMDQSGRTLKDLTRFGQGYADQQYGNYLQQLMQGTQLGMNATGAQTGVQAQGLQGQLGARQSAYNGAMQAAGTIGQGQVAGAQAESAGALNLAKLAVTGAGMAMGSFGGGGLSGLMGSSYGNGSSMSGGGGGYDPNTNMPLYSSGGRPLWS